MKGAAGGAWVFLRVAGAVPGWRDHLRLDFALHSAQLRPWALPFN